MELSRSVAWVLLIMAGLFEVAWAIGLKYSAGFTRLVPSMLTAVAVIASMGLLGLAARSLPIGTACGVDGNRHRGRRVAGHSAVRRLAQRAAACLRCAHPHRHHRFEARG